MISFRYHVVTIAAVFLALAIGLLAGSAFVEPGLVRQLTTQTDNLRGEVRDREDELSTIRDQVAGLGAFSEAALPYLTEGKLLGTPVVIVTQVDVEDDVLAQTTEALTTAGADIVTTVSASSLLNSDDPAVQEQLALILGETTPPSEDLATLAAGELAARLASPIAPPPEDDVLTALLSGGFLAPVGPPPQGATLEEIGAPGQVVVVLSGGRGDEPALPPEVFAVPLVESLAGLGQPVAAGESLLSDFPFVSLLRAAGTEGRVTVDDLDQAMGGAALVLGVDLLLGTGQGGDYGVKDGVESLPPAP